MKNVDKINNHSLNLSNEYNSSNLDLIYRIPK